METSITHSHRMSACLSFVGGLDTGGMEFFRRCSHGPGLDRSECRSQDPRWRGFCMLSYKLLPRLPEEEEWGFNRRRGGGGRGPAPETPAASHLKIEQNTSRSCSPWCEEGVEAVFSRHLPRFSKAFALPPTTLNTRLESWATSTTPRSQRGSRSCFAKGESSPCPAVRTPAPATKILELPASPGVE